MYLLLVAPDDLCYCLQVCYTSLQLTSSTKKHLYKGFLINKMVNESIHIYYPYQATAFGMFLMWDQVPLNPSHLLWLLIKGIR